MALPISEDLGLLVALDTLADGWFHAQLSIIRRTHPAQMTRHPDHEVDKAALRGLITQRVTALSTFLHRETDHQPGWSLVSPAR